MKLPVGLVFLLAISMLIKKSFGDCVERGDITPSFSVESLKGMLCRELPSEVQIEK